ncbi:hypothetical protein ACG02S_24195 [Roseateles sp. DC23W]|uniref:Uncharacterized protein n=1 Tax=Pelomonas dachongensis TaxID=3299029 RepID=A0ABW7EXX7_9BURK
MPLLCGALAIAGCLSLTGSEYLKPEAGSGMPGKEEPAQPIPPVLIPMIPLEKQGTLQRPFNHAMQSAAQDRVAANIVLRSGYLSGFSTGIDSTTGLLTFSVVADPSVEQCASSSDQGPESTSLAPLTMAVVAVEKFNRGGAQRRLEWWLATAGLAMSGRLPDLSLGPAQIRPSTLARLANDPKAPAGIRASKQLKPAELRDQLMDECSSLGIAAEILQQLRDEQGNLEAAVRAYGGNRRETQAVIDYVPVVFAISRLFVDELPRPVQRPVDEVSQ